MSLADVVRAGRAELLDLWRHTIERRLGLETARVPQLVDDMPEFVDELVVCLGQHPSDWCHSAGAAAHGRHRVSLGMDIGAVAEEFGAMAECIFELARGAGYAPSAEEGATIMRVVARGTAESVRAYATLRDQQLAEAASRQYAFLAHELRTPLQTASLATQLLAVAPGDPHALDRLTRAHAQLASLVQSSLLDARLQSRTDLHLDAADVPGMLKEAIENAELLSAPRGIRVSVEGGDFAVVVDRRAWVSALTNLTVNAVKFTKHGGRVTLIARLVEDRALFEVVDECGGLPDGLPARLFQPFVQAGADRSGFGVGLMIVKRVVEAHGGAVRVVDRPPHGCTFVLELPHPSAGDGGSIVTA